VCRRREIEASASTPLAFEADVSVETTLLVPFHGSGTSLVDGREHRWQAGNSAMFLPGSARTGESGVRSVVAITLDPRRLAILEQVLSLLDHAGDEERNLRMLGFDDTLHRIVAHLDEPISLGDLDRVGGIAARTLQASFKKSFNCSPREWIRQRRLLLARERLLSSTHLATVAAVAASCGFTRLGAFAAAYARRFGESPSETLQKRG
jgi:transcriptional regulator GlxA family with amidase domain